MDRAWLAYFPGSPFARMARVLIREWGLRVEEVEYQFPPSQELFEINPLGTVPVLLVDGEATFPTLLVLERLWKLAGRPDAAYGPRRDRQVLLTVLQACDALVSARYQRWAGLGPVGTNHVGYDPAERHLARVGATLAWLGSRRERQVQGRAPELLLTPPQGVRVAVGQGHRSDDQEPYLIRHFLRRPSGVTRIGR